MKKSIFMNKLKLPQCAAIITASVFSLCAMPSLADDKNRSELPIITAQDYTIEGSDLDFEKIRKGLSTAEVWVEGDNFVGAALVKKGKVSTFKARGERHWLVVVGKIMDPFGTGEALGPGGTFTNPSNNKMQIACNSGPCLLHYYSRTPLKIRKQHGPLNQQGAISIPFEVASADSWPAKIFPFGNGDDAAWLSPVQGVLFGTDYGTLMFFPEGFSPETATGTDAHWHSGDYTGVVISGAVRNPYFDPAGKLLREDQVLLPGDHWMVQAGAIHTTICDSPGGCIGFFRGSEAFDFNPINFVVPAP
jgi:hypothetical protein